MARSDHKKGSLPFRFVPIPVAVVQSAEWRQLPGNAKALAIDLGAQYTGKNNGRLTPSFTAMRKVGWTSKDVLKRARDALVQTSFVVQTRAGKAPRTAEWLAFTWWKLDYDQSMEIDPRHFAKELYCSFMRVGAAPIDAALRDPNAGRSMAKGRRVVPPGIRGDVAREVALDAPESGAITGCAR